MSDEKRQTRLLPFRRRRAGVARGGAAAADGRARDEGADAELTALLRAWEAPAPRDEARARLLADFRSRPARQSLWKRFLTASVAVPVPVAACACAALVALTALSLAARVAAPSAEGASGAAARPPQEVRVVEVPVPFERVVTRYAQAARKEEPGARRAARTSPRRPKAEGAGSGRDAETSYFTRVDMAEFEPADDMKMRIIKRGKSDED
ncbi:MAG TPA: hypothetical protein VD968_05715 [Pyrinomonadaceae bacterium]|nr:hypothetical protein [Pyrinomonadaceae bacterium]